MIDEIPSAMAVDDKYTKLRTLLDSQYDFPATYIFKFIVPKSEEGRVKKLFPNNAVELRPSSKGKYTSVTCSVKVNQVEEIIFIYREAELIPGIVSL